MTVCAAIQMVSSPDIQENLQQAEKLIEEAASSGARLLALPENFALMGLDEYDKVKVREADGSGQIQDFLANMARQHAVWLVAGTIPLVAHDAHRVRSACLVYNDCGERVARYDKVHLFDVSVPDTDEAYRESNSIEPGDAPLVHETPFGKLGIAVCYDLRFPEFTRAMAAQGLDILVVPSAFTAETGAAHWEVLLRARAIENLCYVIAPNQGGLHGNGRKTFGHSMIVDPWGKVLACLENGKGFVSANIDKERLIKTRQSFPVLEHRRLFCA